MVQIILRELLTSQEVLRDLLDDAAILAMMEEDEGIYIIPESLKAAMLMVVTVPILCVYPFLQRHFVKGIMLGSLRGYLDSQPASVAPCGRGSRGRRRMFASSGASGCGARAPRAAHAIDSAADIVYKSLLHPSTQHHEAARRRIHVDAYGALPDQTEELALNAL